jgi:hypothetical protein
VLSGLHPDSTVEACSCSHKHSVNTVHNRMSNRRKNCGSGAVFTNSTYSWQHPSTHMTFGQCSCKVDGDTQCMSIRIQNHNRIVGIAFVILTSSSSSPSSSFSPPHYHNLAIMELGPFQSCTFRSLFIGLPWFLLHFGVYNILISNI